MSVNRFEWHNARQLSVLQLFLAFALPSGFAFMGFRFFLPMICEMGLAPVLAWPAIASGMLFLFVSGAIILLKKEAAKLGVSLKERMCLESLSLKQWGIYSGILLLGLILTLLLGQVSLYLTQLPFLSVPDYFPFFLNPTIDPVKADPALLSPGLPLKGAYWLIPLMVLTLTLNILTEELYFRAWLLPKMSKYGKLAWVLNGTLFAFYHTFQLWLLPQILPISLFMAFVVYKSKSIWPALLIHLLVNSMTVLGFVFLIMS